MSLNFVDFVFFDCVVSCVGLGVLFEFELCYLEEFCGCFVG